MKLRKVVAFLFVVMILTSTLMIVSALQNDVVIVGGSEYYDGEARVWGPYITWRRGIDDDSSGSIDYDEASWIMVNNINTGISWNITPPDPYTNPTTGFAWHAEDPDIYNGRIIFEYMYASGYNAARIAMHNITQNETWWTVPTETINTKAFGVGHRIYGDWIVWSHRDAVLFDAFLMNWRTPDEHIWAVQTPLLDTLNFASLNDEYAVFSIYNTGTTEYRVEIYNLTDMSMMTIDFTGDKLRLYATSIYDNILAVYTEEVDFGLQLIDLSNLSWSTTYTWADLQHNIVAERIISGYDLHFPIIYGSWVAYNIEVPGSQPDVCVWNYDTNRNINLTTNAYRQYLTDFKGDKVIYYDNTFSITHYNDMRDDFDVYRTLTDNENISNFFMNIAPFVIVIMMIGVIFGAIKTFGESGDSL